MVRKLLFKGLCLRITVTSRKTDGNFISMSIKTDGHSSFPLKRPTDIQYFEFVFSPLSIEEHVFVYDWSRTNKKKWTEST